MTTQLLIARHGNTFAPGELPRRVGRTDLPLVERGLEQGRLLGHYLKQNQLIPDVIFTSQLQRTIQTAEQAQLSMNTQIPIHALSIFNEIDYGPDENKTEAEVLKRVGSNALTLWDTDAIVPEGWLVSPDKLIIQWLQFAERLKYDYSNKICLVVTSNGIARFSPYITGDFAQFNTNHEIKIATGAVCLFTSEKDKSLWDCAFWNVKP